MSWIAREQEEVTPELARRPLAAPVVAQADEQSTANRTRHLELIVALIIGALIRGWHTWGADFPLNDGGLFYVMVRDIQAAHYHLPAYTSYNGGQIPFGYSPFTFYLTALLNDATGASLITLFRVLPFVASTACIAALYALARAMLVSRAAVAASLIAFAIIPRSFVWLLMGGGLTRSFGYLFALLALHQVWMLYTHRSLRYAPLAALFSALTVLSHLGTAPFVAFSAVLFFLIRGRHREGIIGSLLVGAGTLVLSAPWWATVIGTHGMGPFIAARATGGSILSDPPAIQQGVVDTVVQYALRITGEGRFPLVLVLALIGVVWCVRERRHLVLPVWWVAILVLDARAGFTYAAAPVAMLAGITATYIILPLISPRVDAEGRRGILRGSVLRGAALAGLGVLVLASMVAAASRTSRLGAETQVLSALTPPDRAAMQWVARNTDTSARVLVLTQAPWQIDRVSEWFPVLAERMSVATVQGSEWLPEGAFATFIRRQRLVTACANQGIACLDSLSLDPALRFTHVYAPTGPLVVCCRPLLEALRGAPRFGVIYANDGATIFARR